MPWLVLYFDPCAIHRNDEADHFDVVVFGIHPILRCVMYTPGELAAHVVIAGQRFEQFIEMLTAKKLTFGSGQIFCATRTANFK